MRTPALPIEKEKKKKCNGLSDFEAVHFGPLQSGALKAALGGRLQSQVRLERTILWGQPVRMYEVTSQ